MRTRHRPADLDLRLRMDPSAGTVLVEGATGPYDRLLLAAGCEPAGLTSRAELDGIHYLRSAGDSAELGERFRGGNGLVVVGAGWDRLGESPPRPGRRAAKSPWSNHRRFPPSQCWGPRSAGCTRRIHLEQGVDFKSRHRGVRPSSAGSVSKSGPGRRDRSRPRRGRRQAVPPLTSPRRPGSKLNSRGSVDAGLRTRGGRDLRGR